jgi:hypothetical protein
MFEVPSSSRVVDPTRGVDGALRAFCSFCGGAGRSSTGAGSADTSPRGPNGPSESSSASRVVDCVPKRREGRVLDGGLLTLDRALSGTAGVSVSFVVDEGVGPVDDVVGSSSVAWAARLLLECDRDGTSAVFGSAKVLRKQVRSHSPPQGESSSMVALSVSCRGGPGCSRMRCGLAPSPRRNTPSLTTPSDHYRSPPSTNLTHHAETSSPLSLTSQSSTCLSSVSSAMFMPQPTARSPCLSPTRCQMFYHRYAVQSSVGNIFDRRTIWTPQNPISAQLM